MIQQQNNIQVSLKQGERLEKLTPDQEKLMYKTRDWWLDRFFSCKTKLDKQAAIESIEWMYKLSGLDKPTIVFVDSPLGCQIAITYIKALLGHQDKVRAQVWNQVRDQVIDQVRVQVKAQVWDQVGAQVWNQVRDQVGDQVMDQVSKTKLEWFDFSSYGNIWDYGWVGFYDFFEKINLCEHKNYKQFKKLVLSGVYDMIQLKNFCIVSTLPTEIYRNSENRLHNLSQPAITFGDGYNQHYINGVFITEELFEKLLTKKYTFEDFISEQNEEIKAACLFFMREKWGEDYLISFVSEHLKEVDTYVNKKDQKYLKGTTGGMNIGVYTLFKGDIKGIQLAYVRCYCPSSDRMFYLGVDTDQTNAKDAIASLYRIPRCMKSYIKDIRRQGERFSTTFTDQGKQLLKTLSKEQAEDLIFISGTEYFQKMSFEY
jgi:hypothetical protein